MLAKSTGQENKKSSPKRVYIKKCLFCERRFKTSNKDKKYCSDNCRKRRWDRRHMLEEMGHLLSHSSDVEKAIKKIMEGK